MFFKGKIRFNQIKPMLKLFCQLYLLLANIEFLLYGNKGDMNFQVGCVLLIGITLLIKVIISNVCKIILND
jgi:hypothetical protein